MKEAEIIMSLKRTFITTGTFVYLFMPITLYHTNAKKIPSLVLDTLMHIISKRIYDLRSLFECTCRTADL